MDQDAFWNEVKQMNAEKDNNDTSTNFSPTRSPTECTIFSDDELSFESTTTLPTPLKNPRYSSDDTIAGEQHGAARLEKFVAMNDVPKGGVKNFRFNKIRPTVKHEEEEEDTELAAWLGPAPILFEADATLQRQTTPKTSTMYKQSVGEVIDNESVGDHKSTNTAMSSRRGSKTKPACAECRSRRVRCTHSDSTTTILQPKSGNLRKPKTEDDDVRRKLRVKTEPTENRVKKDGTPYIRIPHDHSKGLSMTASAIDYRERKAIQKEYFLKMIAMIDDDIIKQVEDEGGITPEGRRYKAVVRMLERLQLDRAGVVETMREPVRSHELGGSVNRQEQEQASRAVSPLDVFKAKLQALIDEPE